jgi:hypothetical protein
MTIQDLLTMQSGLAWKESGYAYTPGSGNNVMAMLKTRNWTNYVIDRPMAAQPGTTFNYNSGTAHLVSGVVHHPHGSFCRSSCREAALRTARHSPVFMAHGSRRDERRRIRACAATARPGQARFSLPSPGTLGRSPDRPCRLYRDAKEAHHSSSLVTA